MTTLQNPEPDLKNALDRLANDLVVPGHVPGSAIDQGRRLRARRRRTTAVGAIAAAGVLAVTAPLLGIGTADQGGAGAAGQPTVTPRTPHPPGGGTCSAPDGAPTAGPSRWPPESANVMYRNDDRAPGEEPGPMRGYLAMDLDTGAGFGGLNLIFYPPGSFDDPASADPQGPASLACPLVRWRPNAASRRMNRAILAPVCRRRCTTA